MATSGTLGHLLNGFGRAAAEEAVCTMAYRGTTPCAQRCALCGEVPPKKAPTPKNNRGKFMTAELCNYYNQVNIF
jgi:hypothetical protein